MVAESAKLILWTGPRHSGKTTSAVRLVRKAADDGFEVAGLLAPSIYIDGALVGFDALDLKSKDKKPLARRGIGENQRGKFTFIPEGIQLGLSALSRISAENADLVIVDEFGPVELDGGLWRQAADSLIASSENLMLLVVRRELVDAVRLLYSVRPSLELDASEPESIDKVIEILRNNRKLHEAPK